MSASPFRTTTGPFIEVPVPVAPDSLSDAKKDLEDVPFDAAADIHEFPSSERLPTSSPTATRRKPGFFSRLFSGRADRRLREEMLAAELQDLRASYAGLLHSTDDIRERIELEKESRQSVTKALSPFPAAVAGIEKLQTRQEEASEILGTIRERLDDTSDREETLLKSMDSIHGGVGELQVDVSAVHSDVKQVTASVSDLLSGQVSASASLGDFGEKMEMRFEEAAKAAQQNADRLGQSSDDVLQVLRQMERTSQRGVWIFAGLIAVLFFALIGFSAKMSQLSSVVVPSEPSVLPTTSAVSTTSASTDANAAENESLVTSEPVAEVLVDDLEF
jgi:uncharacterized protein YoxC